LNIRKHIFILLLLTLAACSKGRNSGHTGTDSLVRTIHTLSAEAANSLLKTTSIRCADANDCPSSVGLFAAQADADVNTCTAFLVGEDLAVTNAHCIPSAVKLMPSLCAEKIKLILPASGNFPEETFRCAKLETITNRPNDFSPDLAIIRLDRKTKRQALDLDNNGMIPENSYLAYKVNPLKHQPNKPTGELVAEKCQAIGNSYLFPLYRAATDSVFTSSCNSIPGNSGSPLLNAEGKAAGVLQASLQASEEQTAVWLPYLAAGQNSFARMALGTNLNCLNANDLSIARNCVTNSEEDLERPKITEFLQSSELISETNQLLKPFLAQQENFRWERAVVTRHTLEREETLEPGCIINTGGTDPAVSVAMIPTFSIRISFNRFLQPSAHAQLLKVEKQDFRFSRFDLQRVGEAKVESSRGNSWMITDCQ
jgi:hypothetical protein